MFGTLVIFIEYFFKENHNFEKKYQQTTKQYKHDKFAPLAAEGAMFTFHTFEKNAFKDLQPPEKLGLQYKCSVLILKIVYECIVSMKLV